MIHLDLNNIDQSIIWGQINKDKHFRNESNHHTQQNTSTFPWSKWSSTKPSNTVIIARAVFSKLFHNSYHVWWRKMTCSLVKAIQSLFYGEANIRWFGVRQQSQLRLKEPIKRCKVLCTHFLLFPFAKYGKAVFKGIPLLCSHLESVS